MTDPVDPRTLVRIPLITPPPMQQYHARKPRYTRHDGFALTDSGGFGDAAYLLAVYGPVPVEPLLAQARAFFNGSSDFAVVVESETARAFEWALRQRGWELDEEEPALLLRPIPMIPAAPDDIDIRLVTTEEALLDFMRLSGTGRRWIPSLEAATDPAVALLVGYVQHQPIATARINCFDQLGDVNGVMTEPAFRRHGFGTAMTWAAIAEGMRRGCQAITLSASAMGLPVYLRMGFKPVCTYRTYLPPGSPTARAEVDPSATGVS